MSHKAIITAYGHRNASVEVTGFLEVTKGKKTIDIFKLVQFDPLPGDAHVAQLKLTQINFLIQKNAGLYVWWDEAGSDLVLPLEDKGMFKFDGKKCPTGWNGAVWASAFNVDSPKGFVLIMDFDK